MLIDNLLARVDLLERETSVLRDRLDELEKRGPITVQPVKTEVSAPVTSPVKSPVSTPTSTTRATAK